MVVHVEHTLIADRAVVGARRLNGVASVARASPNITQLPHSLGAILHQPLHILGKALEPVILLLCIN